MSGSPLALTLVACAGALLCSHARADPDGALVGRNDSCYGTSGGRYRLKWEARGASFFDDFEFDTVDYNKGAAAYMNRSLAQKEGLVVAGDTHAIVRTGATKEGHKRASVKLVSKRNWTHFLLAAKFAHVPFGDGVWPAFWMNGAGGNWPNGGELDILEYANALTSKVAMHTGTQNQCKLDSYEVNKCGPFPDSNGMDYDCLTNYDSMKLGCGPTSNNGQRSGPRWAESPGVIALEWTRELIRAFFIPEDELPSDLTSDSPRPDAWDKWVIAYFPMAASERRNPGTCKSPEKVLAGQQIILNIGLCGDWAGSLFFPSPMAPDFFRRSWEQVMGKCTRSGTSSAEDCCTRFVTDARTDRFYEDKAFFNISWMKVFQLHEKRPSPTPRSETILV